MCPPPPLNETLDMQVVALNVIQKLNYFDPIIRYVGRSIYLLDYFYLIMAQCIGRELKRTWHLNRSTDRLLCYICGDFLISFFTK